MIDDRHNTVKRTLIRFIRERPIVVFMNGTLRAPTRPYSAIVADILREYRAAACVVDISNRPNIANAVRRLTGWWLMPQVFVHGEFIGGSDVLCELQRTGDLTQLIASCN